MNIELSPREQLVSFYRNFMQAYNWTQQQIDDSDLVFLLDLLIVDAKISNATETKKSYIEDLI